MRQIVLEADGYQPYLISPEKGLRSLIKIVLEMAKEPSRLCVEEVCPNQSIKKRSCHNFVSRHLFLSSLLLRRQAMMELSCLFCDGHYFTHHVLTNFAFYTHRNVLLCSIQSFPVGICYGLVSIVCLNVVYMVVKFFVCAHVE